MIDTAEILGGEYDHVLNDLATACRQRRKLLQGAATAMIMAAVKVGDTVRFINIRPKYLMGATAEVIGKRRTKLEVKFDKNYGRYKKGYTVTIPSSCVEIA